MPLLKGSSRTKSKLYRCSDNHILLLNILKEKLQAKFKWEHVSDSDIIHEAVESLYRVTTKKNPRDLLSFKN